MKVVLTRPDPDNEALVDALGAEGIDCLVAPMLAILGVGCFYGEVDEREEKG